MEQNLSGMADVDCPETELLVNSKSAACESRWAGKRLRASRRLITIEPIIFASLVAYGTIGTIRTEYVRGVISYEHDLNGTHQERNCSVNTSSAEYRLQQEIQSETSLQTMYLVMCSAGLSMLSAPLLSAWCDRSGRKLALFLSTFGFWANTSMYLAVIHFELSINFLFIGEVLQGLTGSYVLVLAASLAYIADITTEKKRMLRFVVIDTTLLFAIALSQVAIGYVVRPLGFALPLIVMCVACGLALLYMLIPSLLLETRYRNDSVTTENKLSMLASFISVLSVKEGKRHIYLSLLIAISFFMTLMFQGSVGTSILLGLGTPICWSEVTVGIFMAVFLFSSCLGTLVGGVTLPRLLKEHWILYLSCASSVGCYVITGFAKDTLLMFLASIVGCLRNLPGPVIRTMMSKAVTEDEQGVIFAVIGTIESIAGFGSPLLFGALYAGTVEIYPGLSFFVLAGINILPFTLIIILHGMVMHIEKRRKNDIKDNPAPIQVPDRCEIVGSTEEIVA